MDLDVAAVGLDNRTCTNTSTSGDRHIIAFGCLQNNTGGNNRTGMNPYIATNLNIWMGNCLESHNDSVNGDSINHRWGKGWGIDIRFLPHNEVVALHNLGALDNFLKHPSFSRFIDTNHADIFATVLLETTFEVT